MFERLKKMFSEDIVLLTKQPKYTNVDLSNLKVLYKTKFLFFIFVNGVLSFPDSNFIVSPVAVGQDCLFVLYLQYKHAVCEDSIYSERT